MTIKEKTIHYFQLMEDGPEPKRLEVDWQEWLDGIRTMTEDERTVTLRNGEVLILEVKDYNALAHLACHRVKDVGEWLNVRNKGGISSLKDEVKGDILETSAVSFLSYGSVFGLVRGSNSAPSHNQIARSISEKTNPPIDLLARPVTERAQLDKLKAADGVTAFEMKVAGDPAWSAESGALGVVSDLRQEHLEPEFDVYLKVAIRRGRQDHSAIQRLRKFFSPVGVAQLPGGSRATATIINDDGDHEIINLVEHNLAVSRPMGSGGIEMDAAFTQIQSVASDLEDTIKASIDWTDGNGN